MRGSQPRREACSRKDSSRPREYPVVIPGQETSGCVLGTQRPVSLEHSEQGIVERDEVGEKASR